MEAQHLAVLARKETIERQKVEKERYGGRKGERKGWREGGRERRGGFPGAG